MSGQLQLQPLHVQTLYAITLRDSWNRLFIFLLMIDFLLTNNRPAIVITVCYADSLSAFQIAFAIPLSVLNW